MTEVMQHVSNNMPITFSDSASRHVLSYLAKKSSSRGVRLSVKKTGCSGLSYVVDYVDAPLSNDITFYLSADYSIFVDKKSYPKLKGVHVDYVKQGLNYKFVFHNPNQTGQCGCGESFTVDE